MTEIAARRLCVSNARTIYYGHGQRVMALRAAEVPGQGRGPAKSLDRRSAIIAVLVISVIALGSVAVYQQSQLSALSRTISQQSSELAHPSTGLVLSNFTVTKANATAEPIMFLVARNNGTAPASTGSLLVIVYGKNNSIQSCYDGIESFFPLYSNESGIIISPLKCGDIGDAVGLTVQTDFLESGGSVTKVFTARTTIGLSQVIPVSTVVVKEVGVRTFVLPQVFPTENRYTWYLTIINEAPTPITSVHATLGPVDKPLATAFCIFRPVLVQGASCTDDPQTTRGTGPFATGQLLSVVVSVKYSNGTISNVSTTAVVEPPYALVQ